MNAKTRSQKFLRFLTRIITGLVVFLFVLGSAGAVYQTAAAEADRRRFPAPGHLIDVGGFKMHIYCQGEGSPTVILEAMSGGSSPYWGWVQPVVAEKTRVCAYDRAGYGWSEPDPEPHSLARTARNLRVLLANANIEGPYILAGHSLGGVYARRFAADYPELVTGMALIDTDHPQHFKQFPELFAVGDSYIHMAKAVQFFNHLGVGHLYFALGGEMDFSELPGPQKSQIKAFYASPQFHEAQTEEVAAGRVVWAEALSMSGLGDLPLVVISRGQDLGDHWLEIQNEMAGLSTNSWQLTIAGASHAGLVFNPHHAAEVSQAVLQLLETVRAGVRPAVQDGSTGVK